MLTYAEAIDDAEPGSPGLGLLALRAWLNGALDAAAGQPRKPLLVQRSDEPLAALLHRGEGRSTAND